MKKTLTIILAAVIAAMSAMVTITAISVASDTPKYVCFIKETGVQYESVQKAVKALADASKSECTIVMTENSTESASINLKNISVTIEGNGCTIDSSAVTSGGGYQFYNTEGDGGQVFTIRDATLKNHSGFWFFPWTLNIEYCTVITDNGNALYYKPFKNSSGTPHNINIRNTTWTVNENGGTNTFAHMGNYDTDSQGVLNIDNSTIDFYGGSDGDKNGAMFDCYTTGEMDVNILNSSKLRLLGEYGQAFFHLYSTASYDIFLDKGVEIIFESQHESPSFTTSDKATVTDNGAVWRNASTSPTSIRLPILSGASKTQIGWASGDKLYSADGQAVSIEGGAEFSPVFFSSEDLALVSGASLRYADNAYGLRFSTNVSDELYEGLGNHAVYKTYVVPLADNEATPIGDTAREKLEFVHEVAHGDFAEGFTTLHASAVMAPAGVSADRIFSMSLSAYSEMTLSYDNGGTATFVTDFDKTANTRSLSQVAYELESIGQGNALTEYILKVCPYT